MRIIFRRLLDRIRGKRRIDLRDFGSIGVGGKVDVSGYFEGASAIHIGDYCYVGPEAYWSGLGGVKIGSNCMFGPRTVIYTQNHNWNSAMFLPYGPPSEDVSRPVIIGDNCWICLGAHILPGVTIGEGAIVGMGAVVVNDVPPLAVVGGNPAVVLRFRDSETYQRLKAGKKWIGEKS